MAWVRPAGGGIDLNLDEGSDSPCAAQRGVHRVTPADAVGMTVILPMHRAADLNEAADLKEETK
jgi:hypothetical protein